MQFVLQPHFSLLSFTAAADALTTANLVQDRVLFRFEVLRPANMDVVSDLGITILPTQRLSTASTQRVDAVIVCGGYRCILDEDKHVSQYLRKADAAACLLGGLWNGGIALAHARLMKGLACALHPGSHAYARRQFADMTIREDALVREHARLTAAGPNSSFDLMLLFIRRHAGHGTVTAIRNILRSDISQMTDTETIRDSLPELPLPGKLQRALQIMRNNLDEPVPREEIAAHLGMSRRAMERLFQKHFNTSPARYYLETRLGRAHDMLRQGDASIGRIAEECGFVSGAHFSRVFRKQFGQSPSALRQSVSRLID